MAVELLRHSDSRLDLPQLTHFLNSYQRVAPLTLGELWAWPSMLKLALIENLRRLADEILVSRAARRAADADVARIDAGPPDDEVVDSRRTRTTPIVMQMLHRAREYDVRRSPLRAALEAHLERPRPDGRRHRARRAAAAGREPGVGRQRDHQPAAVHDDRLARVRRRRQPRRQRAAARSRRASIRGWISSAAIASARRSRSSRSRPREAQIRVALKAVESARQVASQSRSARRRRTSAIT